ncbi:hypothetical protein B0H17DRAFT_1040477 [Mycena rosella]|uniref:Uncharacterized protein n=1 Tax=Mycena rosella TaxID=1033263 RepID=A0AAD7GS26_MYCRO|nr:hypothetical protein B0H17DRAFT_1040477 [Mycena rosella]
MRVTRLDGYEPVSAPSKQASMGTLQRANPASYTHLLRSSIEMHIPMDNIPKGAAQRAAVPSSGTSLGREQPRA